MTHSQALPNDLFEAAQKARALAHAPYSKFQVGAAIRLQGGEIFSGCNVENASYGATICAERGAICAAVATVGTVLITDVVVISKGTPPWPPCGMCRQFIAEFAAPDCQIFCVNDEGETLVYEFEALFPRGFGAANLG